MDIVEQSGTTDQDREVQETQAVQTESPRPGPWADDLNSLFEDEGVRGQVDTFLREKVQPYVTQLEQQKRGDDDEFALQLYSDLQEDPASTYLAITREMFGPEAEDAVRESLMGLSSEEADEVISEAVEQGSLPAEVQETVEWAKQVQAKEAYNAAIGEIKASDNEFVEDDFHPFVVSAEGNIPRAYEGYKRWREGVKQRYAPQVEEGQVERPQAPPAMGSDSQTASAPPTVKQYSNLDDAIEDFFIETRGSGPPVVGGV